MRCGTVVYFPSWQREGKVSWCARRTRSIICSVSADRTYTSTSTGLFSSFFFFVLSFRTTVGGEARFSMGASNLQLLLILMINMLTLTCLMKYEEAARCDELSDRNILTYLFMLFIGLYFVNILVNVQSNRLFLLGMC